MITLSNETLNISVTTKGAELQSIYNSNTELEYLWSGDARFWGKKSPVLFPVVGGLKNGVYDYNGKSYKLGRHGFARDRDFAISQQSSSSITLSLSDDEKSLLQYPFHFSFSVRYTLVENKLEISYIVENTHNEDLLFSVGGHPAFKVPLVEGTTYEDYYLLFEKEEHAGRYPLSTDGLVENTTLPVLDGSNKLPLKKELFDEDALVFKDLTSEWIAIGSNNTPHGLKVHFSGFPYMGIWAAKGADFVCIEPWCGIADNVNASGALQEKEGIITLRPNEVFEKTFVIEVF